MEKSFSPSKFVKCQCLIYPLAKLLVSLVAGVSCENSPDSSAIALRWHKPVKEERKNPTVLKQSRNSSSYKKNTAHQKNLYIPFFCPKIYCGISHNIAANVLKCDIVVREFEFQLRSFSDEYLYESYAPSNYHSYGLNNTTYVSSLHAEIP